MSPLQPEEYAILAPFDSMEEAVQGGWQVLNLTSGPQSYLAVSDGLARHFLAASPGHAMGQAMGERMGGLGICFFHGRANAVRRRAEDTSASLLNSGAMGSFQSKVTIRGLPPMGLQTGMAGLVSANAVVASFGLHGDHSSAGRVVPEDRPA